MLLEQVETRSVEQPNLAFPPRETVIVQGVLSRLGRPDNFHKVQVKAVSDTKYRVNVYVRADAASYRVAHSYFLETDNEGHVLMSSPAISRLY